LSILLTFNPIRRGLLAWPPATLLILNDCFLVKGLFFPSGPLSLIHREEIFAACVVFLFFLFFSSRPAHLPLPRDQDSSQLTPKQQHID